MFRLKTPCVNCPFRKGQGQFFRLHPDRIVEIVGAPAFQCHKTIDYSDDEPRPGERPQQCAGLMGLLHRIGQPNQIMQVAERLKAFDPAELDLSACYENLDQALAAHRGLEAK